MRVKRRSYEAVVIVVEAEGVVVSVCRQEKTLCSSYQPTMGVGERHSGGGGGGERSRDNSSGSDERDSQYHSERADSGGGGGGEQTVSNMSELLLARWMCGGVNKISVRGRRRAGSRSELMALNS